MENYIFEDINFSFERDVVEKFYLLQDSLKEIACEDDNSYYYYVKIKNKALVKLKKYIYKIHAKQFYKAYILFMTVRGGMQHV